MWIARDHDGILVLFKLKPIRAGVEWIPSDSFTSDDYMFFTDSDLPGFEDLRWEDEPREVEINKVIQKKFDAESARGYCEMFCENPCFYQDGHFCDNVKELYTFPK